jgi:ribosomal protein S18 acetylase RimI-like enzyme
MDAISFREARSEDADAIGAVHVASWRETYTGILPEQLLNELSAEQRSAMWSTVLSSPVRIGGTIVFVAESEAGIVGFGACSAQRDEELRNLGFNGEIGAIYVLEARQRTGIGQQLMRLMARSLFRQGLKAASLWVMRDNLRARTFYERLGGTLLGEKVDELSGAVVVQVAYGWTDLASLT